MRRRTLLAAAPALLLPAPLLAQGAAQAQPLVVLMISDPWRMVIGSDSPAVAIYDDGTLIYLEEQSYKTVRLEPAALARVMVAIEPAALRALAGHYDGDLATDQPTNTLYLFEGGARSRASIYGRMDTGSTRAERVRADVPAKLVRAYDILRALKFPTARDWLPEKIEVMIWPYEYAPDASIAWPKRWPGLDDADTVARGKDDYSIYLPSIELAELKRFLTTRKEKGAVKIGGRKWAVGVRLPFPGEQLWMRG